MTSGKKITLASSRDIPFNKLLLSQANVRRVKAGVSIEQLAEDIARRGLLQGLSVRPVLDQTGVETGMFEIPAGGRRYRALALLVKQKRLAKSAPVPCIVREVGIPEEDSLAENVQRAPLHPLDQFRAFLALREKGQSEEEIAAAFFVSVNVVKQRLKLASVSPRLLDLYAEDALTLDQLMAFTVSGDHERQEQVFERLQSSYERQPYAIRRMLTEGAVRASDKRAQFIGIAAYLEAGGTILRDLFQGDDGGWLHDVALVDRMVAERLQEESSQIAAEGWKWIEVAPEFSYGHTFGLRQIRGEPTPLTREEEAARDSFQAEYDRLSEEHADADELPNEVDERLGELEAAIEAFETRLLTFDPTEIARAGAFVSIAHDGSLRVERGYVRPEDEEPVTSEDETDEVRVNDVDIDTSEEDVPTATSDEDFSQSPISDRLMAELTTHRTLGLRHSLGDRPDVAFVAALHALALKVFYRYSSDSCLELDLKSVGFASHAPGLSDSIPAEAVRARHDNWARALPKEPAELWDTLVSFDADSRSALFAHIVSLSVNAVHEAWNRRPRALAHADRLAEAVDLDMTAAGWRPTGDNFLSRVTKARILRAVAEARGQGVADRIAHLKKGDMATEAEALLADTGWLPEPLRTLNRQEPGDEAAGKTAPCEAHAGLGDDSSPEGSAPDSSSNLAAAE